MNLRTARTLMLLAIAIPLAVGCSDLGSEVVRPQRATSLTTSPSPSYLDAETQAEVKAETSQGT